MQARKPIQLSYSKLRSMSCPRNFKLALENNLPPAGIDALMGSLGHAAAAMSVERLCSANAYRMANGFGFIAEMPEGWHQEAIEKVLQVERDGECRLAAYDEDQVRQVGENMAWYFRLKRNYDYIAERRMYVTRECQPVAAPPADADCFGGTADLIAIAPGGATAHITDYKMGFSNVGKASESMQLMLYAALWMWHHADCDEVTVDYYMPMFNRKPASHTWYRQPCLDAASELLANAWRRIDEMYAEYGAGEWPERAGAACADYCGVACTHKYLEELYANS